MPIAAPWPRRGRRHALPAGCSPPPGPVSDTLLCARLVRHLHPPVIGPAPSPVRRICCPVYQNLTGFAVIMSSNPLGEQRSYHSANATQNRPAQAMIRKTMRIGEVRTSIKLEPEFWGYLKEVADSRTIRLSRLVNDVAAATPERTNLASTLRTFCLIHAQLRWRGLERELEQLQARRQHPGPDARARCLPAAVPAAGRGPHRQAPQPGVRRLAAPGCARRARPRLDNIMILRGQSMPGLWERIFGEAGGAAASMRPMCRRARCAPPRRWRSACRRRRGRRSGPA